MIGRMHPRIEELQHHLERTRRTLRESVASVPAERHAVAPAEGRWSVLAVLEHLYLVESRIAGLLRKKIDEARAGGLGAETDTSPLLSSMQLDKVLNREVRIEAPDPLHPAATRDLDAIWSALDESRRALTATMQAADGLALREITHPHPAFGPLDVYTWFGFVGSHEERHAAQIREIGASLGGAA